MSAARELDAPLTFDADSARERERRSARHAR